MFVLSVEGPEYADKGLWATHKIVGLYDSREEAIATVIGPEQQSLDDIEDRFETSDGVFILTDMSTGEAERIG